MGSLNSVGWLGMRPRFVSDSAPQSVCLGAGKQKLDVGAGKFGEPGSGAIAVNTPGSGRGGLRNVTTDVGRLFQPQNTYRSLSHMGPRGQSLQEM
jgi:hypothetical protein